MTSAASPSVHKVVLNIGGTRFETSHATLSKVPRSFFTRLLSTTAPAQADSDRDGSPLYFIDRDAHLFPHILTWLRAFNPSHPLQKSTNLLVSFRNAQHDKLSDITGLPPELYADKVCHRSLVKEVEFYGLIPLLFALDPTHPAVASYHPAMPSVDTREEVQRAIREWEGESKVPDLSLLRSYQNSLVHPDQSSRVAAVSSAVLTAEQAVSDFDGLGGFSPLLDGVKASLLSKNAEVTWNVPADFDIHKHGDAVAEEVTRRYGLKILILGDQLQLQAIN